MKASTERKMIRWMHILFSIPIVGYIYGPVAQIPVGAMIVKLGIFPLLILSGLWMWKGNIVKRWYKRQEYKINSKN